MTINEVTLKKKLNSEQLKEVAGGLEGYNCPRCGSTRVCTGNTACTCRECSATWKVTFLGARTVYVNPGKVSCPSCNSRNLEFLLRSTITVKYLCKNCQHQFGLQDGHYL